jgi:hypothetical protein
MVGTSAGPVGGSGYVHHTPRLFSGKPKRALLAPRDLWLSSRCNEDRAFKLSLDRYDETFIEVTYGGRADFLISWSCAMPNSATLVPEDTHRDVYLVEYDFGSLGRVWRETDEAGTNRTWMVRSLLEGQYANPVRIVALNTAEGWS